MICTWEAAMRVSDDRYTRDRQKFDLALRLIRHEARTFTIRQWTGLSDDRIRKLYRSYVLNGDAHEVTRHRGKSPHVGAIELGVLFRLHSIGQCVRSCPANPREASTLKSELTASSGARSVTVPYRDPYGCMAAPRLVSASAPPVFKVTVAW